MYRSGTAPWQRARTPKYAHSVARKPNSDDELQQFNMRMPTKLVATLDELVEEQRRARPGSMFTRSDLVREMLYEGIDRRRPKKAKP